jgi:hypothetical protein
MNDQLHAPADLLLEKKSPVPFEWAVGWTPYTVRTFFFSFLWNVTLCTLEEVYRRFRETSCFYNHIV